MFLRGDTCRGLRLFVAMPVIRSNARVAESKPSCNKVAARRFMSQLRSHAHLSGFSLRASNFAAFGFIDAEAAIAVIAEAAICWVDTALGHS